MNDYAVMGTTMTEREALDCIKRINSLAEEIGRLLIDMRDLEGWKALGYQSWTAFLNSGELIYSRNRCLEFARAFPVTISVREDTGIDLKTEQALALAQFPEAAWIPIIQIAQKRGITAPRIEAIGRVMTQAIETGHVTLGDGSMGAFEAAYHAERKESEITRQQAESVDGGIAQVYRQDDGYYVVVRVDNEPPLKTGQAVTIRSK